VFVGNEIYHCPRGYGTRRNHVHVEHRQAHHRFIMCTGQRTDRQTDVNRLSPSTTAIIRPTSTDAPVTIVPPQLPPQPQTQPQPQPQPQPAPVTLPIFSPTSTDVPVTVVPPQPQPLPQPQLQPKAEPASVPTPPVVTDTPVIVPTTFIRILNERSRTYLLRNIRTQQCFISS
jgi:hypothetical protein